MTEDKPKGRRGRGWPEKPPLVLVETAWELLPSPLPRPLSEVLFLPPPGEHLLRIQSVVWTGLILGDLEFMRRASRGRQG
jgi:hypothetical protein